MRKSERETTKGRKVIYPMQINVDFLCRDSILAAPIVPDLVLFRDLAKRSAALRGIGIQERLTFYFKSPMTAPGLCPEHDLFVQSTKLKNPLRHLMGEEIITYLELDYYDSLHVEEDHYARI